MNRELIKEIRKKAIVEWAANNGITVHEFMDEPENIESLEKFAELIIKELERMYISGESDPHDVFIFLLDVKEKFGVK